MFLKHAVSIAATLAAAGFWIAGLPALAAADPLDLRQVPADAKWIAHVDADALRASPAVVAFVNHCLRGDAADGASADGASADASHGWPGSSVRLENLKSVTLYGTRIGVSSGAAIVHGTFDKDAILKEIGQHADVRTSSHDGVAVHSWIKKKGTKFQHEVSIAFPKSETFVYGAKADVPTGIDLVEGKSTGMQNTRSPLGEKEPVGTVLLARGAGLKDGDVGPQFPLFRHISAFDYRLVDRDDRYEEDLTIDADSEKTAGNFKKVFDGSIAGMSLAFADDRAISDLLGNCEIAQNGKQVRIRFHASSAELTKAMPRICESFRAHLKAREQMIRRLLGEDGSSQQAVTSDKSSSR